VAVLNLSDLTRALRPTVVAGDEIDSAFGQGRSRAASGRRYLPDGTMIVVNHARAHVAKPGPWSSRAHCNRRRPPHLRRAQERRRASVGFARTSLKRLLKFILPFAIVDLVKIGESCATSAADFRDRAIQERPDCARCRSKWSLAFCAGPCRQTTKHRRCWREHRPMVGHVAEFSEAGEIGRHRAATGCVCGVAEEIWKQPPRRNCTTSPSASRECRDAENHAR